MNPVDLGVLGAILLCALIALVMGFVRTILALSSWAGAALVTVWGFSYVRPVAREYVSPSSWRTSPPGSACSSPR